MMSSKKAAVTLVAGLLLVLWYGIIFSFSAQNGEASTEISRGVSDSLTDVLDFLTFGKIDTEALTQLAKIIEHPIRKIAHFSEYALMGILVYIMLYYPLKNRKQRFWTSVLWVAVSAAADELHQYFVPGRWASIKDVFLDTCGGFFGVVLCSRLLGIFVNKKTDRQNDINDSNIPQ